MDKKIAPKSLILALLQAFGNQPIPVKALVRAGDIFGFTGNTIRVTTARLVREGSIESNERGLYHLSDKSTLFSRFIDTWRDGEGRLKNWDGGWICCLVMDGKAKGKPEKERAFNFSGFKEGLPSLWVRPDNIATEFNFLEALLSHFGKMKHKEMFMANQFSRRLTEQWTNYLWPVDEIAQKQQALVAKLEKSAGRIKKMPFKNALAESFLLGSEAIYLLISDPLLPDEIMENTHRMALTKAMKAYDELGKQIWSGAFEEIRIDRSPTHLQIIAPTLMKAGGV